ncbi:MAG: hypothetical protein M1823_005057 [Watsoniomyces obsoletus]|nr:MAG: hypothetical protein M1823_005057 [Watsoniomyces obsoletus]
MDWHRVSTDSASQLKSPLEYQVAGLTPEPSFVGLSAISKSANEIRVGICFHDGTFSTDSAVNKIKLPNDPTEEARTKRLESHILSELAHYRENRFIKLIGAGVSQELVDLCPRLCSRLWLQLDLVPIVIATEKRFKTDPADHLALEYQDIETSAGMRAHSAVRKCLPYFGPNHIVRLCIGPYKRVEVDAGFKAVLVSHLDEYQATVGEATWRAVMTFAEKMKNDNIRVAFFSSTPQGGGVALMRHALMRFFHVLGVKVTWHVPKPDPSIFRITKNNHNILQGVADEKVRLKQEDIHRWECWIHYNAQKYWTCEGGPLSKSGADVIVIDDPQMPGLIEIAKKIRPDVPVIFRSHIQIRSDLISQKDSPQEGVWEYLWSKIKLADLFISHPVLSFVPNNIDRKYVGLLPASTDWLDGLNKPMPDWDSAYYMQSIRSVRNGQPIKLDYPRRKYITQVARFDPSKGIPDVISAYVQFRERLEKEKKMKTEETPQLLICGHGSIDDPDASHVYQQTLDLIQQHSQYASDMVVIQLGPSDQLLNTVLTHSHFALQLSIREGFEVKVSEALHKGKPIVATRAGGIGLQVRHGMNGFLINPGDPQKAAEYMFQLFTDGALYKRMAGEAKRSVSDEVGTVGSAVR